MVLVFSLDGGETALVVGYPTGGRIARSIRAGQVRAGQVRAGQVRAVQVRAVFGRSFANISGHCVGKNRAVYRARRLPSQARPRNAALSRSLKRRRLAKPAACARRGFKALEMSARRRSAESPSPLKSSGCLFRAIRRMTGRPPLSDFLTISAEGEDPKARIP